MPPSAAEPLILKIPTPYPVGRINVYFLDGPEPTLVDTGVYSSVSLAALAEQLRANGRRLEEVRHILITHGHYDHAGAALHLSRHCGATLYLHRQNALFTRRQAASEDALIAFLVRCGISRATLEKAFANFHAGRQFADLESEPPAVRRLNGDECLSIGGREWQVIATPGHSPDHLCFHDRSTGQLFCGDMLLTHITPNPLLYLDPENGYRRLPSLIQYLESLTRLEAIEIAAGFPGHGPIIPDVAALIAGTRQFVAAREAVFLENIRANATDPAALARAVFGKLDLANQFLAISETVAYLDLLEQNHHAKVDWSAELIAIRSLD